TGDPAGARASLIAARNGLRHGSDRWARATLLLAEVESQLGNIEPALDLAHEVRRGRPRGLAARRARRLADRLHRAHPELALDHVDEAETRLREGDAAGARDEVEVALVPGLSPPLRARLLWVRAQAERALGLRGSAEATCIALARESTDPLAPRALTTAATWRWNADEDEAALRLFAEVVERFPRSAQAADALYAIGRIAQEAGRYDRARASYARVADRFPHADVAPEARWRAGWVRYLSGDMARAEEGFARSAAANRRRARVAAEYWRGRALERLGRTEQAHEQLGHVADRHRTSYYAGLAEQRLGRSPTPGAPPATAPTGEFPADLAGPHAERARLLAALGLRRFARLELDALGSDTPRRQLLEAYHAIGAVGAALRLAHAMRPRSPGPFRQYLYPLGYWDSVRPAAQASGIDPLLVTAVIRQESLFEPEAVSPVGARGLMQLMPATARRIVGNGATPRLEDPSSNVRLGVALLAQLLERYGGSVVKALAAYNGGEDAVAKWERRYAGREPDEFVELISFRETRDYVKAVLRNYRLYRALYAVPSASTTNAGSPPKAPFDMMTMTSSGRAVPTR
ncbi:MAG TPA: transglycosylase SLT domain-containing protein, partial [Candidatus Binatus sp.]|nr:transglycosylase SLT domain-containing protein [Candidatus Binatus sp.]